MASIALRNIRCIDYLAYVSIFTCATFRPKIKLDVFFSPEKPKMFAGAGGGALAMISAPWRKILDEYSRLLSKNLYLTTLHHYLETHSRRKKLASS